jgi:phage tail-like protein
MPDSGERDRGTWELLFQRARGRYLQLRIGMVGNTRSSPRLRALRAYYPRFSYLEHYLPAAYRNDVPSASFLDRFLANLEGIYTALEDRLDAVAALFDPRSAPAEDLAWLATWLGILIDGNWDPVRQRLLIAMAPELFRLRGTRLGLIRAIRLATDECPTPSIFESELDDEAATQPGRLPSSVRVVEQFRTRLAPGVVFGDPSQIQGPGISTPTSAWEPEQGTEPLHAQFRAYLNARYETAGALSTAWAMNVDDVAKVVLPPTRPGNTAVAADWSRFLAAGLGFTYAEVDARDTPYYRKFLTHRYGTGDRLSQTYGLRGEAAITDINTVELPVVLPVEPHQLRDWIQFVSTFIPTLRNAHRFTVLVPTVTGQQDDDRGHLLDRVRRLVELEKPAHTAFEVKEYWALFRVGEARLGFDTLVDRGSRLVPIVLDASYLVQGYLAPQHPYDLRERMVLGRDRLEDRRPL